MFTARPLTLAEWQDLETVFGGGEGKGECGRCWCMWWRLPRGPTGFMDGTHNKALFRARVAAGPPPGLVGYADGDPVGWVQVGPRADVPEWNRPRRLTAPGVPAEANDPAIWGASCFVVRVGHRRRGHAGRLLDAALERARQSGARCLDACPVEAGGKRASGALFHGPASLFRARGFSVLAERRAGRPLMRFAFPD